MAGQVSHVLSISNPFPDIDINIKGTAVVMEALKNHNPEAVLVYGGTRGQYGKTQNPAKETDYSAPTGIHEISHLAAEQIITTYNRIHGIPVVLARMTNIYGPRAQIKHDKYGVVNWFIRLVLENKTIPLFGRGEIIRDFLYIDDCVDALLILAQTPKTYGKTFNVASGLPTKFITLVKKLIKVAGSGSFEFKEFTFERKSQEVGDFWADISKIKHYCNWQPQVSLTKGLRETVRYYQKYRHHYL
jgi:UDP-glucose 4-epimerase